MSNPTESTPNAANVRRRLRGSGATPVAVAETAPPPVEAPASQSVGRSSAMIPRPKLSGLIARPRFELRPSDPGTRTPLPHELPRPDTFVQDESNRLHQENQELRGLIEQAIAQEEENERQAGIQRRYIDKLEEQVELFKSGAGESGELVVHLQERADAIRVLNEQVQQLELQLQYAQETGSGSASIDQYVEAVQQRDDAIANLSARVVELEEQIANVPPPAPTDEELARMADELERERCLINQLRKELDDEKKQHAEDEAEMEKQMREMEVQMSKERAEIARQRTDLQRAQSQMQSDFDSSRQETNIRDRLQQSQRMPSPDANAAAGTPDRQEREAGFMTRLFGKR